MRLTIEIPSELEQSLERQLGPNIEQAAREALAIAWYQSEKLSIGQVAEFLSISVYEAEGLMKQHHVESLFSHDDLEHDRHTLNRLLGT